jgi:hypothetical protein
MHRSIATSEGSRPPATQAVFEVWLIGN